MHFGTDEVIHFYGINYFFNSKSTTVFSVTWINYLLLLKQRKEKSKNYRKAQAHLQLWWMMLNRTLSAFVSTSFNGLLFSAGPNSVGPYIWFSLHCFASLLIRNHACRLQFHESVISTYVTFEFKRKKSHIATILACR